MSLVGAHLEPVASMVSWTVALNGGELLGVLAKPGNQEKEFQNLQGFKREGGLLVYMTSWQWSSQW